MVVEIEVVVEVVLKVEAEASGPQQKGKKAANAIRVSHKKLCLLMYNI